LDESYLMEILRSTAQAFKLRGKLTFLPISLALLIPWLVLVRQLSLEWNINPQYSYGWGVLVLILYSFFQRSKSAHAPATGKSAIIFIFLTFLASAFLPLRLVAEANPDWRLVSWSMALIICFFTSALVWFCFGKVNVLHFAFPIFSILIAVPWPVNIENRVIQGLAGWNSMVAVEILSLRGIPALVSGNTIVTAAGTVGIEDACSGIRSLQATFMIAWSMGELFMLRVKPRLFLLGTGILLAFLANLFRTLFLVNLAASKGIDSIAEWHDITGTMVVVMALLALWVLGFSLDDRKRNKSPEPKAGGTGPASPFFQSRRILLGFGIWFLIVEIATECWYRYKENENRANITWDVRWPDSPGVKILPMPERVILILKYSVAKAITWKELDATEWMIIYLGWKPGRAAVYLARSHQPEICLPSTGRAIRKIHGPRNFRVGEYTIPFRAYEFWENGPMFLFHSIWEEGDRNLVQDFHDVTPKNRIGAVKEGRRMLGQKLIQISIAGVSSLEEAEKRLQARLPELLVPSKIR